MNINWDENQNEDNYVFEEGDGAYEVSGHVAGSLDFHERYFIDAFDRKVDAQIFAETLKFEGSEWDNIEVNWVDYSDRYPEWDEDDYDYPDDADFDPTWDEDYDYTLRH